MLGFPSHQPTTQQTRDSLRLINVVRFLRECICPVPKSHMDSLYPLHFVWNRIPHQSLCFGQRKEMQQFLEKQDLDNSQIQRQYPLVVSVLKLKCDYIIPDPWNSGLQWLESEGSVPEEPGHVHWHQHIPDKKVIILPLCGIRRLQHAGCLLVLWSQKEEGLENEH